MRPQYQGRDAGAPGGGHSQPQPQPLRIGVTFPRSHPRVILPRFKPPPQRVTQIESFYILQIGFPPVSLPAGSAIPRSRFARVRADTVRYALRAFVRRRLTLRAEAPERRRSLAGLSRIRRRSEEPVGLLRFVRFDSFAYSYLYRSSRYPLTLA